MRDRRSPLARLARFRKKKLSSRAILGFIFGQTLGRSKRARNFLRIYPKSIDAAIVATSRLDSGQPVRVEIAVDDFVDRFLREFRDDLRDCYAPGQLKLSKEIAVFELPDCEVICWLGMTIHRPTAMVVAGRPRSHHLAPSAKRRHIPGAALAIMDMPAGVTSYYHFFEDIVVALRALKQIPASQKLALLFAESPPPYQAEVLKALECKFPNVRVQFVGHHEVITADRLFQAVPRPAHAICWFALQAEWREAAELVRNWYEIAPRPQTRRVYFSRRNLRKRRIVNESKLEEVLASNGIEAVSPEMLTHADQLRLMAEVSMLAGVSGAALTNMMFAANPITVVEVLPGGASFPFWCALAFAFGHKYRVIVSEPAQWDDDITLEPTALSAILQEAARL